MRSFADKLPDIWRPAICSSASWKSVRIAGNVICRHGRNGQVLCSEPRRRRHRQCHISPAIFEAERLLLVHEPFLIIEWIAQNREGVLHIRAERIEPLVPRSCRRGYTISVNVRQTFSLSRNARDTIGADQPNVATCFAHAWRRRNCSRLLFDCMFWQTGSWPHIPATSSYTPLHMETQPLSRRSFLKTARLVPRPPRWFGQLSAPNPNDIRRSSQSTSEN